MRPDIKRKAIELSKLFGWEPLLINGELSSDGNPLYIHKRDKDPTGKKFNPKYETELARKYSSLSYLIDEVFDKCDQNISKVSTVNNTNDMKLILLDSLIDYYKQTK